MKTNDKWFAVEFAGSWMILNEPFYEGVDQLNADNVGIIEAEKNAKLAAAAPQLLKALKLMMREHEDQAELTESLTAANEAIEKVKNG